MSSPGRSCGVLRKCYCLAISCRKPGPRRMAPGRAPVFQGGVASVMVLTGQFEDLFSQFIFAQWIFYALTVA